MLFFLSDKAVKMELKRKLVLIMSRMWEKNAIY